MAYKTMLRQLISKWGIMSIDMVSAMDSDLAVINEDGTKDYVESEEYVVDTQEAQEEPEQTAVPEYTEYTTHATVASPVAPDVAMPASSEGIDW